MQHKGGSELAAADGVACESLGAARPSGQRDSNISDELEAIRAARLRAARNRISEALSYISDDYISEALSVRSYQYQ